MAVSGAERTKHYRKRRRHGITMVANVEILEATLSGLIDTGRLDVRNENDVKVSNNTLLGSRQNWLI